MGQFVKVGTTAELEDLEGAKLVEAGGRSTACSTWAAATMRLTIPALTEADRLSQGMLAEDVVICPWHGARFDVKTGAVLAPPAPEGVKSYPVRVNGNDVEIEVG